MLLCMIKLAKAAPTMTQSDLVYSVEKTPSPTSQLPQCAEDMYTRMGNQPIEL